MLSTEGSSAAYGSLLSDGGWAKMKSDSYKESQSQRARAGQCLTLFKEPGWVKGKATLLLLIDLVCKGPAMSRHFKLLRPAKAFQAQRVTLEAPLI